MEFLAYIYTVQHKHKNLLTTHYRKIPVCSLIISYFLYIKFFLKLLQLRLFFKEISQYFVTVNYVLFNEKKVTFVHLKYKSFILDWYFSGHLNTPFLKILFPSGETNFFLTKFLFLCSHFSKKLFPFNCHQICISASGSFISKR